MKTWITRALAGAALLFALSAAQAMTFPNQDHILTSQYPTGNAVAATVRLRPDGTIDWIPGGTVSPYRVDGTGWFDQSQGCAPSCSPTPGANFDYTWSPSRDASWTGSHCEVIAASAPPIEAGFSGISGDLSVDQWVTIGAFPDGPQGLCEIDIVLWFKGTAVDATHFKVSFIFAPSAPFNNDGYMPGGSWQSSFIDNMGSYFNLQGSGWFDNEKVTGGYQFPSSPQQWYTKPNYNVPYRPGDWSSYRLNISGDTSMLTLDTANSARCAQSGTWKPLGGALSCTVGWKNYGGATIGFVYNLIVRVELVKTDADLTPAMSTFTFTYRMRKCGPWGC